MEKFKFIATLQILLFLILTKYFNKKQYLNNFYFQISAHNKILYLKLIFPSTKK
jgi:hypothetical protein